MLLNYSSMALGESAIEVMYKGNKGFATIVIDANGGAGASPLVSLGVSDTDVATAVTNVVVAFTGLTTSTLDDLVVAISNTYGGTVDGDDDIKMNDFQCRIKDGIRSDSIYHATVAEFADEAGTAQNLKGYSDSTNKSNWFSTLVRDNDAEGVYSIYKRIPEPSMSKGAIALRQIGGVSTKTGGTALDSGLKRTIYSDAGDVLWTLSVAAPTAANMAFDLDDPIVFDGAGPIIVKDECLASGEYADLDATTTYMTWGYKPNCK